MWTMATQQLQGDPRLVYLEFTNKFGRKLMVRLSDLVRVTEMPMPIPSAEKALIRCALDVLLSPHEPPSRIEVIETYAEVKEILRQVLVGEAG